jgi:hypothetical protein
MTRKSSVGYGTTIENVLKNDHTWNESEFEFDRTIRLSTPIVLLFFVGIAMEHQWGNVNLSQFIKVLQI